jgi:hypothetical protein
MTQEEFVKTRKILMDEVIYRFPLSVNEIKMLKAYSWQRFIENPKRKKYSVAGNIKASFRYLNKARKGVKRNFGKLEKK